MPPGRPAIPRSFGVERSTIQDVAEAAGVSVATVSRALRGLPNVAVTTRARVEVAARQLDYRPDPHASRLAAGRSRTVAVVVPFINSWYFANVIAGVEAVCSDDGYDLLVLTAPTPAARTSAVVDAFGLDRRVDGMIFVEVALDDVDIGALERLGLGVVTIGQRTKQFPSISVDNVAVGRAAVEHLVELGHARVGILAGQAEDPVNFDVPGDRIAGARAALFAAGHEIDPDLVAPGQFTVEGGRRAASALLARRPLPTALFALSDEMAFGALIAARELSIDIPGDVSLVGVDDHEIAEVMGLTTVRQHVVEHGARAAATLLRRLAGDRTEPDHEIRQVELVVRGSTRPCLPSDP
jgi:LacI family transcriptional regulator, repressor for deo operon, udp, cdd, tsx, nupC, and nupG